MKKELLTFDEDFIYNKDEANIDEIRKKLKFSSVFGNYSFFVEERFYKKGDEEWQPRHQVDNGQRWEKVFQAAQDRPGVSGVDRAWPGSEAVLDGKNSDRK